MEKFKDFIKNFLQIVITAVVIVFICFKFLFISTEVKGSSMYPTLQDGDRGFSFVITRNISINRFDICVIDLYIKGILYIISCKKVHLFKFALILNALFEDET